MKLMMHIMCSQWFLFVQMNSTEIVWDSVLLGEEKKYHEISQQTCEEFKKQGQLT